MKYEYEAPLMFEIGALDELTGSGGKNNKDGWGYSILA